MTTEQTADSAPDKPLSTILENNVSKRIVKPVLKYIDMTAGQEVTEKVLAEIKLDREYFDDVTGYMPLHIAEDLFNSAISHTGDHDFAYHCGRSVYECMARIDAAAILLFISPVKMIELAALTESKMVRTTVPTVTKLGRNRYRVSISFRGGYREPPSACRNRQGFYEGITRFYGLPFAKVEHIQCAFRGASNCVYDVTLPDHPFYYLRRVALVTGALSLLGAFPLYLLVGQPALLVSGALASACLISYAVFIRTQTLALLRSSRESIQTQDWQIEKLRTDVRRTEHLHHFTLELSRHMHRADVARAAVDSMVEKFEYESCQVWLVNSDGNIRCVASRGLPEPVQKVVDTIEYSLDVGLKSLNSFVHRSMGLRETLLINDPRDSVSRFTTMTKQFIDLLNPSSGIIVGLVDNDRPVGMFIGLHHSGKKVGYLDRVLFEAAAPVLTNAVVRAALFEDMNRRITERGESIRKQQQELLGAREMAIQSEKLAALGKMAAGVAHEINNPLNFLINIVPDLRRDTEGLAKILALSRVALPAGAHAEQIEALLAQSPLMEHLQESSYVFQSVDRSLERARKVTYSLKVFSRLSASEAAERLTVDDLVQQVLELIPQKYLTSVSVCKNIDSSLKVLGARNELVQVLLSLIQNALDAMSAGGVLSISTQAETDQVQILVADTGPGIPANVYERLFEPFFTTKDPTVHNGLGLTVALEIVKKYRGTISASSADGKGAVFTVTLPATQIA